MCAGLPLLARLSLMRNSKFGRGCLAFYSKEVEIEMRRLQIAVSQTGCGGGAVDRVAHSVLFAVTAHFVKAELVRRGRATGKEDK